jgi:DnaJ-class molecular chaperone
VAGPAPDDEQPDARPCDACRGTGVVISNLGGEPHGEPCPWCDGGGVRLAGHDAQARWRDAGAA